MPVLYVVVMLIMSSIIYCTGQKLHTKVVWSEHTMYRNFAYRILQVL